MVSPNEIIERENQFNQVTSEVLKEHPLELSDHMTREELDRSDKILNDMIERREQKDRRLDNQIDSKKGQESILFWLLVCSGIIALALLILGVYPLLQGNIAVGVLAEFIALFPAVGTATFWKLSNNLSEGINLLNNERESNLRDLQSLHSKLLISDPSERAKQVNELTKNL